MDAYAAVSLDDGVTFKQVNLSESADLSSFNLDTDHNPSKDDPLPKDHNILLGGEDGALHAKGYDTPYDSHCTECHGVALQGTAQTPSCYSCHDNIWVEDWPEDLGPIVYQAEFRDGDTLDIEGENAGSRVTVTVINAISGETVGTDRATRLRLLRATKRNSSAVPCRPASLLAEYTDVNGIVQIGPAVSVMDEATGVPIENCEGSPLDLTEYPGGVYNVFHATAGNKTLVAWPSRFCESGAAGLLDDDRHRTGRPRQQARLRRHRRLHPDW